MFCLVSWVDRVELFVGGVVGIPDILDELDELLDDELTVARPI